MKISKKKEYNILLLASQMPAQATSTAITQGPTGVPKSQDPRIRTDHHRNLPTQDLLLLPYHDQSW